MTRSGRGGLTAEWTVGFGTAVAMWAIGYVCHVPPVRVPGPVVLVLLLAALAIGGALAARWGGRGGLGSSATSGFVTGLVNLLVVGGVVGGESGGVDVPSLLLWIPGSLVGSVAIAVLGGSAFGGGEARRRPLSAERSVAGFGLVAVAATFFTVIAGGLVTSHEAGLAVPDWPNSFGAVLFLFPLAKMTGGIYFEHAHRLYGMLAGLSTVVLAVLVSRHDARSWVRRASIAAVVLVIVQGLMGGLRVTGSFTLAEQPDTDPNTTLAIVHGVFGQLFFLGMVMLAVVLSPGWKRAAAATARSLRMVLPMLLVLVTQLALGAVARHLSTDERPLHMVAMIHMAFALLVAVKVGIVGIQARGCDECRLAVRKTGTSLLVLLGLQIVLGVLAMFAVIFEAEQPAAIHALAATAHQANGALLLGAAGALLAWSKRPLPAAT